MKQVCQPIYINGRFLTQGVTGVQRYARETLMAMDRLLAARADASGLSELTILAPAGAQRPALQHIGYREVGRLAGHLWEQTELAWHARDGLLFTFGFTGPLLHRHQITTVHDAAVVRVPQAYTARFRLWYTWMVRWHVRRSPATAVVSAFSRQEAIDCFGAPDSRLHQTTEGWQHMQAIEADTRILDQHNLRDTPFLLAVSSANPSKNFSVLLRALALLGDDAPPCVIAGATHAGVFRQGEASAADRTIRVGYVSDAELKALYQHAACFVFPSLYEGFGIPPLEAMSCGCPVIASTAPAVREVCGEAALYFEPQRPEQLALAITRFFREPDLAAQLKVAARQRIQRYSWEEGARLNLAMLARAASPLEVCAT
ncbi:glycosyltransferase [Aquabacterium fontiphilum]|uniref:glycosyltransferase family 4 protein n=1 Tax=Aquabacterium fontiphilum TaxID=450365 RepID=UPI0013771DE3|nr:glycosyltransferase family 1 protein [Aquabacterium fontiphilum]NBD20657.1 glycosyltransferase [Aquabacterium fontiphilum]